MAAERIARAFWPLWSVLILAVGVLALGVQDLVPVEALWAAAAVLGVLALAALVWGVRAFRWPRRAEAMIRLDQTMPGRPIETALDSQATGLGDPASQALWQAHQARMRGRLAGARAPQPDLRVSRADPFALRYVALLTLCTGLLFGSLLRVGSVTAMAGTGTSPATGPTWEGWVEPPAYTHLPSLYLNDIDTPDMTVAEGSRVTLRMYGPEGALTVRESVSANPLVSEAGNAATAQDFTVARSGILTIEGTGGRSWAVAMTPDAAPTVALDGPVESTFDGEATFPYAAKDDYGVTGGSARFELALDQVNRRYGLVAEPQPRQAIEVPLPMPIAGNRAEFTEALVDNFSQHPWANLPVRVVMTVEDAAGHVGQSESTVITLPGRRFFEPVAAALIEQRRALLWTRNNAGEVAQVLRAVSYKPEGLFRKETAYLKLRSVIRRTETLAHYGMTDTQQEEIAQALWDLAVELEDGDLDDARERLNRAQDRLTEAMKNGASDAEIAELMQELRDATEDYMRQLAQQAQRERENNLDQPERGQDQNSIEMTQNDLQRMMDRIQELMEQGRMAEAAEALEQLRQMMENMQVTEGQGGGQQSPGQQAMEGLAETLRDQQELSDDAFRDLQDQFNPGQGQQGQQGQQGDQQNGQQGQEGSGQQQGMGQGQDGQQPGNQQQGQGGDQAGQGQSGGDGEGLERDLAERQRALRDELNRQRNALPGAGTEAGERARDSLGRAEDAMDDAERALRDGDLAEAIDNQSQAMEALREGMRDLGEALAQQQQQGQGQTGMAQGADPSQQRDPLGRNAGTDGQIGTDESLLQGDDVYRRARELLDEIRRRSGQGERTEEERNYLERLLDRF
ncbi:MAG: TIGR02302 family protein [Roseivivax sp.]|nr:TIGR02302 family protein [Roseivivax sp.]